MCISGVGLPRLVNGGNSYIRSGLGEIGPKSLDDLRGLSLKKAD